MAALSLSMLVCTWGGNPVKSSNQKIREASTVRILEQVDTMRLFLSPTLVDKTVKKFTISVLDNPGVELYIDRYIMLGVAKSRNVNFKYGFIAVAVNSC